MQELENHINRINQKLGHLLKAHNDLLKQNHQQKKEVEQLQQQKKEAQEKIDTLHQQINILKASLGSMNEADKKKFEQHLNRYVKEIDKCITFLSN